MPLTDDQLERLVKENVALNQDVLKMLKRMHRALLVGRAWSIAKLAVIVLPLIWGYFALRPYLTQAVNFYSGLLGNPVQGQEKSAGPNGQIQQLDRLTELLKLVR
ncbi:MAG: hypothetical protein Q7S89_02795 [bacterium]|nr:hypothetical protein [bacterium]